MEKIGQKNLKINAILNVIKTFMSLVFPLVTFPYASRILLPQGLGKVNFAAAIISYFAIISSLGIENYGIREAAKIRDDKKELSQFSKEIFIINVFSTFIAYILLIVAILCIPKFSEYKVILFVTSITILFNTIGMNWLYSALEDYLYITIRSILFQIISLVLLFVFVHKETDYIKYAEISVFSNVGSNLFNFIHIRKFISFKTGLKLDLKKHIKPVLVLFIMAITVKIYTVLDTTMLGFMKGDWEVGIYTAATKINKMVLLLVVSCGTVLLPRLSYYSKLHDKTKFLSLSYKGFDILFLMAVPCTVGLNLLSDSIIHVLSGTNYNAAIVPMRIMNPIIIIIGISNYIGIQMFMPLNKEKWTLYSVAVGALVNVLLNTVLIPRYGSIGASVATLIAESSVSVVQLILVRKYINIKKIFFSFLKYFLNSLIMAIPIFLCKIIIKIEWVELIFGFISGICTYFLLLLLEKNTFAMEVLHTIKNRCRIISIIKK